MSIVNQFKKDSFTVVIRSRNCEASENSNSCHITPIIPSSSRYLSCRVLAFMNDVQTANITESQDNFIAELVCRDFSIENEYDTAGTRGNTIAISQVNRIQSSGGGNLSFVCSNFNNRRLHFMLLNPAGTSLLNASSTSWNYPWILVMEITELDSIYRS